jgi:hypothetical protein
MKGGDENFIKKTKHKTIICIDRTTINEETNNKCTPSWKLTPMSYINVRDSLTENDNTCFSKQQTNDKLNIYFTVKSLKIPRINTYKLIKHCS